MYCAPAFYLPVFIHYVTLPPHIYTQAVSVLSIVYLVPKLWVVGQCPPLYRV